MFYLTAEWAVRAAWGGGYVFSLRCCAALGVVILGECDGFVCCSLLNFNFCFVLIPQPAEYGAEELSLNAVPTLGLVRVLVWVYWGTRGVKKI